MKALLLYPQFPKSFWSYERVMRMAGLKTLLPPLGMITVAALLPKDWEIRFFDRNVGPESEADWDWCELVVLSAMLVQRPDFHELIAKAVGLGKTVVVGGPYPTAMPQAVLEAGAHFLVLDEGELTLPPFLEALARGEKGGVFRAAEKPEMAMSPVPRFDLLQRDAYFMMSVQFSRGCPFTCEFCDIITLYGRRPRTKAPSQTLAELQALYELGWRGPVFIVDDNFIGNQKEVKTFLRELIPWMEERGHPFTFKTEASVNLAEDDELLLLMRQAGFYAVFLGIETPDQDSLQVTKKIQNTRHPLVDACRKINEAGLLIYAGFVLGFDGERKGAGARIQAFVEETCIPQPMLGTLRALPNTALWNRLKQENRLVENAGATEVGDENRLLNFIPTRPVAEIAEEYVEAFWNLYEPASFLRRSFRQCFRIGLPERRSKAAQMSPGKGLRLVARLVWLQGVRRPGIRMQFWRQLFVLLWKRPQVLRLYFGFCAAGEHFWEFRDVARERVARQLARQASLENDEARRAV